MTIRRLFKKWLLAYIWEKYRKELHDLFIGELILELPDKVERPAIELMAKDRALFNRFLYYEASSIFRRDPTDFGSIDRRNGMLVLIKALLIAIGTQPDPQVREVPGIGDTLPAPPEWQKAAQEGQQAAEAFKKGKKPGEA